MDFRPSPSLEDKLFCEKIIHTLIYFLKTVDIKIISTFEIELHWCQRVEKIRENWDYKWNKRFQSPGTDKICLALYGISTNKSWHGSDPCPYPCPLFAIPWFWKNLFNYPSISRLYFGDQCNDTSILGKYLRAQHGSMISSSIAQYSRSL